METRGRVQKGVIVLDAGRSLPEGTVVTVLCDAVPGPGRASGAERAVLPLVRSERPGALRLTGEGAAQALEEEDLAS